MTFYDDVVQVFKFNLAGIAKILRNEDNSFCHSAIIRYLSQKVFISPFHGLAKIGKRAKKVDALKE